MNLNTISMLSIQSLTNNRNQLDSSLQKLSSGLRINKASDDASGLAIADKLRTQVSSIRQGIHNGNSAITFIQIGDKAMQEQSNILDITKSKLIQASTSTTSNEGREAILKDIQKSLTQYDNIASQTSYNGITLLQKDANDTDPTPSHDFYLCGDVSISISDIQSNTSYGGTAQVDNLIISGEIKENDIFTVNINGTSISYIASASDAGTNPSNHNSVVLGIKSQIESNPILSSIVSVENTENGELTLTSLQAGQTVSIQPGTITLNTNLNFVSSVNILADAQKLTYDFTGTIESGDSYTVGGVSYTVQDSDNLMIDIIDKIIQGLNGTDGGLITGLTVSSSLSGATATKIPPNQLVLTADTPGTPFTPPSVSTSNLPSLDDQSISLTNIQPNVEEVSGSAAVPTEHFLELTGTANVESIDFYNVRINLNSTFYNFRYNVQSSDTSEDDIINGIFNLLNNDFNPTSGTTVFSDNNFQVIKENGGLTITSEATGLSSISFVTGSTDTVVPLNTVLNIDKTQFANGGNSAAISNFQSQIVTANDPNPAGVNDDDTFEIGDTVTFNYDSTHSVTYTVQASDIAGVGTDYVTRNQTNINVYTKLFDLMSNDAFINSKVTSSMTTFTNSSSLFAGITLNIQGVDFSTWDSISDYSSPPFSPVISYTGFEPVEYNASSQYIGVTTSIIEPIYPVASKQAISTISITSGDIVPGSVITVDLGTEEINYTIQSSNLNSENVMDGILNEFNNSTFKNNTVEIIDDSNVRSTVNQYDISKNPDGTLTLKTYLDTNITSTTVYSDVDIHSVSIEKSATPNFTTEVTVINDTYEPAVSYVAPEQQQEKYTLGGTVEEGDKYRVGDITYTVQPGDTTLEDIVDKLIIGINGGSATGLSGTQSLTGVTATKDTDGTILLTADVAGTAFTPPDYEALNVGINDQDITLTDTIDNVVAAYESIYDISGFLNSGNTYDIGGAIYTSQIGDTKENIIDGLIKSINGDSATGVSGTPLSSVTAYKNSSNQIVIKSDGVAVPDYTISSDTNLSNLTSTELSNDISLTDNTVTLNSSSSKYISYSENSIPDDIDETQNINTYNLSTAESLGVLKNINELDIQTSKNFLKIVDKTLNVLNEFRSRFGSAQVQVESAIRTMMTCETNISYAESVIRDIDYASESANFSKLNIIEQAGTFALSQSVEIEKNSILNLLKN